MRYQDWDVLLFPRDSKVPFKEFKVACHVVHDTEPNLLGGTFGLPTVCCFVPSLPSGAPFRVSIHSWNAPSASHFAKSYSQFSENAKFEARLFIDGRLVASTMLDSQSTWPHIIALAWDTSTASRFGPLQFPSFRRELLHQDWWVPADDLGRIKIVLSEGFPRDSASTPFERVKNIVAFSFQHAPIELLETSAIAWPNPSMWCRAPFATSVEVPSIQADDCELHGHSPRRRSGDEGRTRQHDTSFQGDPSNAGAKIGTRRTTHPLVSPVSYVRMGSADPFGRSKTYYEWLNGMNQNMQDVQPNVLMRHHRASRNDRRSSTDISMPDYTPGGSNGLYLEPQPVVLSRDEGKQGAHLKVPTNTPTATDFGGCEKQDFDFPIITDNPIFPSNFADSLTNSLLNQPMPINLHNSIAHVPSTEIKSRKENEGHSHCGHLSTPVNRHEHQDIRLVSQQFYISSGSSVTACNEQKPSPDALGCVNSSTGSAGNQKAHNFGKTSRVEAGDERLRTASDKGNKRVRNFTPASARAIDEEDEPRRCSPRIPLVQKATAGDGKL